MTINCEDILMKKILYLLLIALFFACTKQVKEAKVSALNLGFDSLKASNYGADDYGMKTYVMAFLKKGPNRDLDSTRRSELQRAHLKNISKMAEDGKLVLAGPFYGDGEIRGIYIFDVGNIEEAKELTETDPAIKAGSLCISVSLKVLLDFTDRSFPLKLNPSYSPCPELKLNTCMLSLCEAASTAS